MDPAKLGGGNGVLPLTDPATDMANSLRFNFKYQINIQNLTMLFRLRKTKFYNEND